MSKPQARLTVPMVVRMRKLAAAGLGCEAIAAVIEVDFGQRPSRHTVAYHVGRKPGKLGMRKVHTGSFKGCVSARPRIPLNAGFGGETHPTASGESVQPKACA